MAHDADPDGTVPILSSIAALRMDDDGTPASRYAERGQLGAGGMGEVRLCDDRRTGREVAMKVAHVEALHERFFHEARIQAQLEHPSIVPVYDIGLDASGAPYFTMKRVRGVTLRDILKKLRKGDAQTIATYSRRRLLTAFATICMTVHYAHTRNVLHRDLKPSNIMLGEYGELYVLDWGVASAQGAQPDAPIDLKLSRKSEDTTPGDIVGTPGYIAPEQLQGRAGLDARADVYSLGAILFGILALEPLHPLEMVAAMRSTTLGPSKGRPSARARGADVPPELDAICEKAIALDPEDRYPSALALHDAVDRYLEGDRDLERRRELSATHALAAQTLAGKAKDADAGGETELRGRALGEVSQALALDPANEGARRALLQLLTEPPREVPAEAMDVMKRSQYAQEQAVARSASWLFLFGAVFTVALACTIGFHVAWYAFVSAVLFVAAGLSLVRLGRTPYERAKTSYATVVTTTLAISWMSGMCGPLFIVPTFLIANTVGFLMQPNRTRRPYVLGLTCAGLAVPLALEWAGLVPPSYVFRAGTMIVVNRVIDLTSWGMTGVFGCGAIAITFAIGLFFIRFRDVLSDAEQRLHLYAWHLRQLVPRSDP